MVDSYSNQDILISDKVRPTGTFNGKDDTDSRTHSFDAMLALRGPRIIRPNTLSRKNSVRCNIPYNPDEVTVLRAGNEGRQSVFRVAHTWIVRIFELHDGYRQPAAFIARVLAALERAGAPAERIRHHGVVPGTPFHYTVTQLAAGGPLARACCANPGVRAQHPGCGGTVEAYMHPRLAQLRAKLAGADPAVAEQVGELATLSECARFRMVVSHNDLAEENIFARFEPSVSISVIDWEFCAYIPEFRNDVTLRGKVGRELWGEGFYETYDIGFGPYPERVVWTERLCMIAEDYEGTDFEKGVLGALNAR
ncbi:hypothetical protein B0H10DRAFT_2224461 [Mycena sp. CBHHK59/15]|nr:hypothetical protein B0H10DRAFT_2224461 [Mycena sp. CBHHK59/15]